MFNKLSAKTQSALAFIDSHKVAFTAGSTAIVTTIVVGSLQKAALQEAYEFIDAAGLTEKFIESVPFDEIYS